ncbi:hypothetical protein EVAR_60218_1 [Eumeta japonica]|uniref:Uncharacterized protein n=1 Tax=Eumeta variegata TaxID=151549 RepID=A0A4C1ZAW1_EUMVA|nr:hypothetical protein EVAR_60218_1 [Eumeta japonica]
MYKTGFSGGLLLPPVAMATKSIAQRYCDGGADGHRNEHSYVSLYSSQTLHPKDGFASLDQTCLLPKNFKAVLRVNARKKLDAQTQNGCQNKVMHRRAPLKCEIPKNYPFGCARR